MHDSVFLKRFHATFHRPTNHPPSFQRGHAARDHMCTRTNYHHCDTNVRFILSPSCNWLVAQLSVLAHKSKIAQFASPPSSPTRIRLPKHVPQDRSIAHQRGVLFPHKASSSSKSIFLCALTCPHPTVTASPTYRACLWQRAGKESNLACLEPRALLSKTIIERVHSQRHMPQSPDDLCLVDLDDFLTEALV